MLAATEPLTICINAFKLEWNKIKVACLYYQMERWSSEDVEAKSFWDEFFYIFDIKRRLASLNTM